MYEECLRQRPIKVLNYGECDPCSSITCTFGSVCVLKRYNRISCSCVFNCSQFMDEICGSDGKTYYNECYMKKQSCLEKREIRKIHKGTCDKPISMKEGDMCGSKTCGFGGKCVDEICICSEICTSKQEAPVCGSDGMTYANQCQMLLTACASQQAITPLYAGDCLDRVHTDSACETMSCLFGGKCVIQGKQRVSTELCICSFMCENTRIPVCGTDGKIYMNECFMARASCNKQTPIDEISMDLCDEQSESFCDGFAALMKDNEVITCSNDELKSSCPHYAYCHVIEDEGRCCQGYHYVSKCETSKFGCCPDNQTSALGPAFQGCENNSSCQCSNIGSVSQECDKYTKKCKCKENVEGQQCDRCENNYWGFLKLLENKNSCTACDCDPLGSTRADCDQMTGKCVCLKGVIGHKCNYCIDGSPVSEKGCFEVFDLNLGNTNLIPLPTKASTPVHALTSYPSVSTHRTFSPTDDITSSDFIKPYFNGDSFLQLMPFTHGSKELNIKIQIRSLHHEGIMFFMGALDSSHQIEGYSTARGYALLSFRNGSLEFKYDLGTGSTTLRSQVPLKTNHPYTITAQRRGRDGLLIIDEHTKVTGVSGGRSKFLDASNSIYIGALPSHFTKNRKSGRWRQGFVGCVNSLSLYSGTFSHHYDLSSASADVISTRKIRDCDEVCADYSCLQDPQCSPKADFICKCPPRIYGRYCEKFENDNRYYNDIFYNNRLDDYNSYSSKYHLYNNNY